MDCDESPVEARKKVLRSHPALPPPPLEPFAFVQAQAEAGKLAETTSAKVVAELGEATVEPSPGSSLLDMGLEELRRSTSKSSSVPVSSRHSLILY